MSFSLPETQRLVLASALGIAATAGAIYSAVWWYRRSAKPVFKPVGKLSDIWIHPIKSCRGHRVSIAECTPSGLWSNGIFDRHFIVLSDTDAVVTLRQEPTLALIESQVSDDGQYLLVDAPGMDTLRVSLADLTNTDNSAIEFRIWRMNSEGLNCGSEATTWLSTFLKKPGHKLIYFKEGFNQTRKPVRDSKWGAKFSSGEEVSGYVDLAPVMMTTEASLADVNSRIEKPVTMRNIRPNLVVSGTSAFEEDQWKYVKIGDNVTFRRTHGCGRCRLTTVDPETGTFRSDGEPLKTLKMYRTMDKSNPDGKTLAGAPVFGSNLVCDGFGPIKVGDTVYAAV